MTAAFTSGELAVSILTGYARRDWANKLVVMLQAFVDDSASDVGVRRFVLAGYVLHAQSWASFMDEWSVALLSHPRIEYLKMAEAQSLRGQFRGWDADGRDAKLVSMARVIERYKPWSIECSVSRESFDRILKPVAVYPLKTPYHVCFAGVVISLARYHSAENINLPVDFVFDDQGSDGEFAAGTYWWLKDDRAELASVLGGTPQYRDDKKIVALQAADMLAWHIRRAGEQGHANGLAAYQHLFPGNHVQVEVSEEELSKWAREIAEIPGVDTLQTKKSWKAAKASVLSAAASRRPIRFPLRYRIQRALKSLVRFFRSKPSRH